jgi:hypothetical protein
VCDFDRTDDHGDLTMIAAQQLLRQWDAGRPVWSWRVDGNEHRVQCMAFEILRWFLDRPRDLKPLQRIADGGKEGAQFVSLIHRLEAIPAIRNMHPYTDVQLAKALVLARALANYDADEIPYDRRIRVRRLVVVAA